MHVFETEQREEITRLLERASQSLNRDSTVKHSE